MTKRKKGQIPYESAHPTRIEMPDVPGHRQKGSGKTVNKDMKREMEDQIEKLKGEIIPPVPPEGEVGGGGENKG